VVIGVTGTNGKTTTVHMIEHILREAGKNVAMISTVDFSINGEVTSNESKKTTLSPFITQKFLRKCVGQGVKYVVLEASSHALHQSRLWGIPFSISVITNITHEHLDYHGTMEKYKEAKKILFRMVSRSCRHGESALSKKIPHHKAFVLNTNDKYYEEFKGLECDLKISYGIDKGDLKASKLIMNKGGSHLQLIYGKDHIGCKLHLIGTFNVENALAAAGAALACDLTLHQIREGLESFRGVSGRMERIKSPKGFEVIVDFALTPDALDKLYSTLQGTVTGRIFGIIGSCGERDKEKRPVMGKIVAHFSDITIVTDEEPYSENPMEIMVAVLNGAKELKVLHQDLQLIPDRYGAIEYAVQHAEKNDLIVVTGMGSFKTRSLNDGEIPWDEREVVREIINSNQ
jgi:UDP-N-acetylmuramoyl-L-alanyl-D-glutamate--2,6-diaminopimelate ligase